MAKIKLEKGDKILARSPAIHDENPPYKFIGGHVPYDKSLTVTKVHTHGVSTQELGFIHDNNILLKVEV